MCKHLLNPYILNRNLINNMNFLIITEIVDRHILGQLDAQRSYQL